MAGARIPLQIAARVSQGGARQVPRNVRKPMFTAADVPGKIHQPGQQGYHGPHPGKPPKGKGSMFAQSDTWENRIPIKNMSEKWAHEDRQTQMRGAKVLLGISGGAAVSGIGGGLTLHHYGGRKAARIRAGVAKSQFQEAWHAADPFIRHARVKGKVHNITSMEDKPGRARRIADWVNANPGTVVTPGLTAGFGGLYLGASSGGNKLQAAQRDVARRRRAAAKQAGGPVTKAFKPAHLTPGGIGALARKYPGEFAVGVGAPLLAGGTGAYLRREHRGRATHGRAAESGVSTAAGGALASVGYTGAGLGLLAGPDKAYRLAQQKGVRNAKGEVTLSRSAAQRLVKEGWKKAGRQTGAAPTPDQEKAFYRNFPDKLPGWRRQRVLGYFGRGTTGRAIQGGLIAGGALAGHKLNQDVYAKALYAREDRVSPLRAVELAAGIGLGAWGLGRSRMLGAALAHGVKMANARGADQALYALKTAQVAQGTLKRGTAPGELAMRRIQAVDAAVERVPGTLRGDVATAAGLLLAGNAHPISRERYTPVSRPIPVRPMGW
jgi:hypothetical protein